MGLFKETIGELEATAREWLWSILKTLVVCVPTYGALRWLGLESSSTRLGVVMALVVWGSVMFFIGPRMTGSGFWAGFRGSYTWVDTPTSVSVWRLGASRGAPHCLVVVV